MNYSILTIWVSPFGEREIERDFPYRDSMVNLAAIMTVDKARLVKRAGELSADKMAEVDAAIKASLGVE